MLNERVGQTIPPLNGLLKHVQEMSWHMIQLQFNILKCVYYYTM